MSAYQDTTIWICHGMWILRHSSKLLKVRLELAKIGLKKM